ncbi:MAG: sialate O-acetylesterase [Bacteroidota bacterium]
MPIRLVVFLVSILSYCQLSAQVKLPTLISDNMVLQRDADIKVWGWAAKGEAVTVSFNNRSYKAVTDAEGKWAVVLPKMKAGGPYKMDIKASNELHIDNILFGDVWLCSGQSNMVVNMERVKEKYPDEIASANYPEIRNFFIPTLADATKPHEDLPPGKWMVGSPKNVLEFGAASYFFAKSIYLKNHIPIGIINSSVGGTPIEAWISEEGLKEFPDLLKAAARFKDTAFINGMSRRAAAGNANRQPRVETDKGLTGPAKWFSVDYVPQGWKNIIIPGFWADQGIKGLNGVVWYRREINVPASMTGTAAKLFMGRIIDADQVYVNGVQVGNITYQYPPRRYTVAENLLKEGKNLIVVRVTNTAGKGGFVPDKPYYLTANGQSIDLKGEWQYKVGDVFIPGRGGGGGGGPISQQNTPTALYNAMIAPMINYPVKGMLWYQGEANTGKPEEYRKLLPALINDWRNKWNSPSLPFYYVQLPNFMEMQYLPSESQWAVLRESELQSLSVPNTAMAVAIDLGEWNDIHPLNKKDVGERLALPARRFVYGETNLVSSGPIYQSATIENNKIRVTFSNTGSGLINKGGEELTYFAIAGADKKFVWAKATIENNTVVVWSDEIKQPMYVRYAWADNPDGANLYNKEGLPASPFRTDQ